MNPEILLIYILYIYIKQKIQNVIQGLFLSGVLTGLNCEF